MNLFVNCKYPFVFLVFPDMHIERMNLSIFCFQDNIIVTVKAAEFYFSGIIRGGGDEPSTSGAEGDGAEAQAVGGGGVRGRPGEGAIPRGRAGAHDGRVGGGLTWWCWTRVRCCGGPSTRTSSPSPRRGRAARWNARGGSPARSPSGRSG